MPAFTTAAALAIVSNAGPFKVRLQLNGGNGDANGVADNLWEVVPGAGGVASALMDCLRGRDNSAWFADLALRVTDFGWEDAVAKYAQGFSLKPVLMGASTYNGYYDAYSTGVLWYSYHNMMELIDEEDRSAWSQYVDANARFARSVIDDRPRGAGNVVWVHDYQLSLVPAMVRQGDKSARISFFLHIPFPRPEVFQTIPQARELLGGMLGADIIGFHVPSYRDNFRDTAQAVLGSDVTVVDEETLTYRGRSIRLRVYPIGIKPETYDSSSYAQAARDLRREHAGRHILLGIDRLDPSKNIPGRLRAYREFLRQHPEQQGRVILAQFAVPSREKVPAYIAERKEVERLVAEINNEFGTDVWLPVKYHYGNMSKDELLTWYRAAAVMLITARSDGMNLVAKEFVWANHGGSLLLSHQTGAAYQFGNDAVIVDGIDDADVARGIYDALVMPEAERLERLERMKANVASQNVTWWTNQILTDIESV
jgi:trehalose 6-phosphate synthase/phosphatase